MNDTLYLGLEVSEIESQTNQINTEWIASLIYSKNRFMELNINADWGTVFALIPGIELVSKNTGFTITLSSKEIFFCSHTIRHNEQLLMISISGLSWKAKGKQISDLYEVLKSLAASVWVNMYVVGSQASVDWIDKLHLSGARVSLAIQDNDWWPIHSIVKHQSHENLKLND